MEKIIVEKEEKKEKKTSSTINNSKKNKQAFEGIIDTLYDNDFAMLRCLLKCSYEEKDKYTRECILNLLESNNRISQFIESLLTNLRDPKIGIGKKKTDKKITHFYNLSHSN